jgi:hypothetical protein|tara:strand:+ start:236 stop:406 length:171 start_codon:yes stop_codon:yes gene_type:complete
LKKTLNIFTLDYEEDEEEEQLLVNIKRMIKTEEDPSSDQSFSELPIPDDDRRNKIS